MTFMAICLVLIGTAGIITMLWWIWTKNNETKDPRVPEMLEQLRQELSDSKQYGGFDILDKPVAKYSVTAEINHRNLDLTLIHSLTEDVSTRIVNLPGKFPVRLTEKGLYFEVNLHFESDSDDFSAALALSQFDMDHAPSIANINESMDHLSGMLSVQLIKQGTHIGLLAQASSTTTPDLNEPNYDIASGTTLGFGIVPVSNANGFVLEVTRAADSTLITNHAALSPALTLYLTFWSTLKTQKQRVTYSINAGQTGWAYPEKCKGKMNLLGEKC